MPTIIFDRDVTSKDNIELLPSPDFKFKYIIAARNNRGNENVLKEIILCEPIEMI